MKWFLSILSQLHALILRVKNEAYDKKMRPVVQLQARVISVGNLSMGGTGKTPVVSALASYFLRKNKRLAIVSRAYKAQVRIPTAVNLSEISSCELYGDEPCLLQTLHPQSQVFVGQKKSKIARFAEQYMQPEIVLVDDGFQHRKLHRDLDVVLIDASENVEHGALFPLGRLREDFDALKRAHAVLLTKCNLSTPDQLWFWKQKLQGIDYFAADTSIGRFSPLREFDKSLPAPEHCLKAGLISALAKNAGFRKSMEIQGKFEIVEHFEFSDHHLYSESELDSASEKFLKSGVEVVLTTAKDAVKMKSLWKSSLPVWVAHLQLKFHEQQEERFYAKVANLLF